MKALVITTRRGRRYTICPACTAVGAPIPVGASRHTCPHCGAEFTLSEKPASRKREAAP